MKKLIWRMRYTREARKLIGLDWRLAWEYSHIALTDGGYELTDSPEDAAEDERDAWLACCQ